MNCRPFWVERVPKVPLVSISSPADHVSFNAAQVTFGFLVCECRLLFHIELRNNQHPKFFCSRLLLIHSVSSLCFCFGLPQPRLRTLQLTFLSFRRFPWARLSSPTRSLWMASLPSRMSIPHTLVLSANCWKRAGPTVHVTDKVVNSAHPKIDTWGVKIFNYFELFWS